MMCFRIDIAVEKIGPKVLGCGIPRIATGFRHRRQRRHMPGRLNLYVRVLRLGTSVSASTSKKINISLFVCVYVCMYVCVPSYSYYARL